MTPTPEEEAREQIDRMLNDAGWVIQDVKTANVHSALGVAIREFPLHIGYGFADYLLYVNGRAAGVVEAKKKGTTLTGVEFQTEKYSEGLAPDLPAHVRPLPQATEEPLPGASPSPLRLRDRWHRRRSAVADQDNDRS